MRARERISAAVLIAVAAIAAIYTPAIAADQVDPPTPATTPSVAAGQSDWRTRFNAIYRLEEGQIMKFVPASSAPERMQYYRTERPSQAQANRVGPPQSMAFQWDGSEVRIWSVFLGGGICQLDAAITYVLRIPRYQFEGPGTILSTRLPDGDFIIRRNTSEADRLAALLEIVRQRTGRNIHAQLQNLEREVIVVRGRYGFHPLPDSEPEPAIQLYVGVPGPDERASGNSGDLDRFLQILARQTGRRVIDETDKPPPQQRLAWRTFWSSNVYLTPEGNARAAQTDQLLALIAKQTDLSLIRERRKLPVWVLSEQK